MWEEDWGAKKGEEIKALCLDSAVYGISEYKAYLLLLKAGEYELTAHGGCKWHEAGNRIIALAEQIKAERAVLAMK